MIRLVQLLRRPHGMSHDEFAAIWRDEHGPLVASLQTTLDLVRHVQLHPDPAGQGLDAAAAAARSGMQPSFDGIMETWWRSEAALRATLESDVGNAAHALLVENERRFLDMAASPLWLAREYPQVASGFARPAAGLRSGVMRLHFALQPLPHLTDDAARRYWLTQHGPLVRSHAVARGTIAYNQVHRDDDPAAAQLAAALTGSRGTTAAPYLGHAEAWFDRLAGHAGPEKDNGAGGALADERNFIDWDRSTLLVGKELVFVEREWA
ncbi:MAG: EthD domain-containing protein [Pseudomonadota bacterium]